MKKRKENDPFVTLHSSSIDLCTTSTLNVRINNQLRP